MSFTYDAARPRLIKRNIFGYDIFISYAWKDARLYANSLANRLGEARYGYRCFLDDREMPIGTVLAKEVESALHRSSAMIVIVTPEAFNSSYVEDEVRFFSKTKLPILPLVLKSGVFDEFHNHELKELLKARIWETDEKGSVTGCVSEEIIGKIEGAFRFVRINRIRTIALLVTSIVFAGLAAVAWYQRGEAIQKALEVRLEMRARATDAVLQSGLQTTALSSVMRDVSDAYDGLGYLPGPTWKSLRDALEGARETSRFDANGQLTNVTLSADDGSIVTINRDGEVIGWGVNGDLKWKWRTEYTPPNIKFAPSGQGVLVSTTSPFGAIKAYDLKGRQLYTVQNISNDNKELVDVSQNGNVWFVSNDGRGVNVVNSFETKSTSTRKVFTAKNGGQIKGIRTSRTGERLAVFEKDGNVTVIDFSTVRRTPKKTRVAIESIFFADGELTWLAFLRGNQLKVWDMSQKNPNKEFFINPYLHRSNGSLTIQSPSSLSLAKSGFVSVTYENDSAIQIYRPDGMLAFNQLRGGPNPTSTIFSSDGLQLIVADYIDLSIRKYDLQVRTERSLVFDKKNNFHGLGIESISWCPDDDKLVWISTDGGLYSIDPNNSVMEIKSWRGEKSIPTLSCLRGVKTLRNAPSSGIHGGPMNKNKGEWHSRELDHIIPMGFRGVIGVDSSNVVHVIPFSKKLTMEKNFSPSEDTRGQIESAEVIAAIPDRSSVVVAGRGKDMKSRIALWDVSGKPRLVWIHSLPGLLVPWTMAAKPNGSAIAVGGALDSLYVFNFEGSLIRRFDQVLRPGATSLTFTGEDRLAAGSLWGEVVIFEFNGGILASWSAPTEPSPANVTYDSKREQLYVQRGEDEITVVELSETALIRAGCAYLHQAIPRCSREAKKNISITGGKVSGIDFSTMSESKNMLSWPNRSLPHHRK